MTSFLDLKKINEPYETAFQEKLKLAEIQAVLLNLKSTNLNLLIRV